VDQSVAEFVQKAMSDKLFRVYLGTDIIGCEIAGTSKA
jgi:glycerol-3-phosphate dehydrogenase